MATPTYPRHHVFTSKKKKEQPTRRVFSTLRCANPYCHWVYKFTATSFERGLLQQVWDVANNTCCQEPRVTYYCPPSHDVRRRADEVKALLLAARVRQPERAAEIDQRLASVERHAARLERSLSVGCRTKYKEYASKQAQADALLQQRALFAKLHHALRERDFPRELQLAQHAHLHDLLRSTEPGGVTVSARYDELYQEGDDVGASWSDNSPRSQYGSVCGSWN